MLTNVTFTYPRHNRIAYDMHVHNRRFFDRCVWALEPKHVSEMVIPDSVEVVTTDFPRSGNLNGKAFIDGSLKLYAKLFDEGATLVCKSDSDTAILRPGRVLAPMSEDACLRGYNLDNYVSGSCYVMNRAAVVAYRRWFDTQYSPEPGNHGRPTSEPEDVMFYKAMRETGSTLDMTLNLGWVGGGNKSTAPDVSSYDFVNFANGRGLYADVLHLARCPNTPYTSPIPC